MDCTRFERWLDEGMAGLEGSRIEAEKHAGSCGRCAAAAEAAGLLESALAAPAARAPAGFTDRVMSRVRAGTRFRGSAAVLPSSILPLWIRVLADPAAAIPVTLGILALMIAGMPGVVAGLLSPALRAASILFDSLPEWPAAGPASLPAQAGITLAILPVVWLASCLLFRWTETLFSGKGPGTAVARRGRARPA